MVRRWCLALAALGALLCAGCVLYLDGEQAADGVGDDVATDQCFTDVDCVLAGPTCCDCPTYAMSASSGWADGCANVECMEPPPGTPSTCTPLVAHCSLGTCVAVCAPVACEISCPQGFAADAAGCLSCTCNTMPAAPMCQLDDDCVEVPADCCGCERGGASTAVPRGLTDEHLGGLGCARMDPMGGSCPDVSTCDPARVPRCLEGQCALVGPNDPGWQEPPPGACGRPDLPPCPAGETCVLNEAMEAGPLGLGVCAPAP